MDLKELSNLLGLSPTTVSRALNGYSDVSQRTRERVATMAQQVGYKPNAMARRLALGRTDAIGLAYPMGTETQADPGLVALVEGLVNALGREQMDLLIAPATPDSDLNLYQRLVRGRRVDGIVLAQLLCQDPRIDYLLEAGVPFLTIGRSCAPEPHAWVDFDHALGMSLAVERLVSQGHRRIAYIHASTRLAAAMLRREGFLAALEAAVLPAPPELDIEAPADRRGGYAAMLTLIGLDEPPSAVVIDNNLSGLGAIRALMDAGRVPGRECSVIVCDGAPADHLLQGQDFTSIEYPLPPSAGETVAQRLLGLIRGGSVAEAQVLWSPSLHLGTTDGPARP